MLSTMSSFTKLLSAPSFALALLVAAPAFAGELHDVTTTPAKAAAGAPAKASVKLSAKNGWKLNADAPITLKLTPPAGVTLEKPKLGRKDLAASDSHEARFDVAFTATEPGAKNIEAECSFVICQESACKPVKEKVTLALDVTAPKKK